MEYSKLSGMQNLNHTRMSTECRNYILEFCYVLHNVEGCISIQHVVFESLAQPRRGGDKQRGGEKRRDGEKGRDGEVEREALKSILRLSREKEIQRKVLEQEEERNKIYD
ncbi:hypothetical protein Bca4012_050896 [Brassica carinata]